ncbi:putative pentatricopeptide repeat-containing protein At3g05240 [Telopea speciosissima]|uniref:putative pentatricopeptide repeat-containing protein At3g05240 n=1 Tax=Telopea speciosissima TaxID=54955 RepID=UPI001CC6595A|nr:putative pentatricopeptide repeat-containing protein At3g05240 [Telopea speciosissima]
MTDRDLCSRNIMIAGYAKIGQLNKKHQLFEEMPDRDNCSWSSMISGYSRNDQAREALELYGPRCCFMDYDDRKIRSKWEEHRGRMLGNRVLGHSGRFEEAEEIIDNMPMKPDKFLWASLLGGCRIHANLRLAKRAAEGMGAIAPPMKFGDGCSSVIDEVLPPVCCNR